MLIDRNNCGKVGHKCNGISKECSEGVCSMVPTVKLTEPNIIWQGALNGSKEFDYTFVILPMNITLYNTTTNNVSVTTHGVSFFSLFKYSRKTFLFNLISSIFKSQ
jgi:hypothetical protein